MEGIPAAVLVSAEGIELFGESLSIIPPRRVRIHFRTGEKSSLTWDKFSQRPAVLQLCKHAAAAGMIF